MKLNSLRLLVDDFEGCLSFYRDILGLEVTLETEDQIYAQLIGEGVSLGLYQRHLMADVLGSSEMSNARAQKDTSLLVFQVKDVDASIATLKQKGAGIIKEPHDQAAWFMRMAHLRDPDGNLIELFHPLDSAT